MTLTLLRRAWKWAVRNEDTIDVGIGKPILTEDRNVYQRLGVRPVKFITLPTSQLQVAFEPDFEPLLTPFYRDSSGHFDHSIRGTPHFRFLEYYRDHGSEGVYANYRQLDYYHYFMSLNTIGYKTSFFDPSIKEKVHFTDESILNKMKRFMKVHDEMCRFGYAKGPYTSRYISVFREPFATTRFGLPFNSKPYEVFVGHHRATVLAVSGIDSVEVLLLEDAQPMRKGRS